MRHVVPCLCILLLVLQPSLVGAQPEDAASATGSSPEADVAQGTTASLDDFRFLVGHWRGEALGGVAEEVWLEPSGGAMVGTFRLVKDQKAAFYEIFTIAEPDLTLRLKHFHADLTGWEEREEVVTFPLVRVEDGEAVFEGLTLRLLPDGRLRATVETRGRDGSTGELVFVYERVR